MMNHSFKSRFAFTLVEMLVVLTMAAMVLTATLTIYQRLRGSAVTIVGYMERSRLQDEILQKIAEDIDRLAAPGFEATIKFRNKLDSGYYSGQLILENSYYGSGDKKQTFEQIIWQTWYSIDDDILYLYRMHDGLNVEDKVLEKNPDESPSAGLYIPVARGVTFFELRTQQGENVLSAWTADNLPQAVRVGISFAPPQELSDGTVGIPDDAITYRTIAIDRTRMIPYQFVKKSLDLDILDEQDDPNSPASGSIGAAAAADEQNDEGGAADESQPDPYKDIE